MKIDWKNPDDVEQLQKWVRVESNAKQRDRYRAVLLAGLGLDDKPELTR